MSYVVSARKYRPARFDEVVGQQHVSQTLKKALQTDHLAHAFLFCGPRGVGKTTCARILAKVLNCQHPTDDHEPCGTCDNCKAFQGNASFNIMELDAASNNSVEHIRSLVEQVRFQPQQGKYKIFIIDEVHMLSQSAFNAFLKTLEEPPSYAIFILATTEKHKIIPTILSRCQIFDFKRIQVVDIVHHLEGICGQEGINAEPEALHIIAQKADGALRDALSIFDRVVSFSGNRITYADVIANLNVLDYDYYFRITEALITQNLQQVLLIFDEITRNGFEGDLFINGLAEHLRNLLVCKDKETLRLLEVSSSLKERYHRQATVAPASFILTALNIANDCDVNYKMARNKPLHVEMALIKMTYISQAVELVNSGGQLPVNQPGEDSAPARSPEKKTIDLTGSDTKLPEPEKEGSKIAEPRVSSAPVAKEQIKDPPLPTTPAEPPTHPTPATADEAPAPLKEEIRATHPEPPLPTPAPEKEAASEKPAKLSLRKSKKSSLPTLQSLDSMHAAIKEAEANGNKLKKEARLNMEDLEKVWSAYAEQTDKGSVKTILKGADVSIQDEEVTVVVGSALAESTIRQENQLMDFLRTELHAPKLAIKIKLDPSRSNAAPAKPKKLTDSEKYWHMKSVNPLVDEVRKRFDLRLDND